EVGLDASPDVLIADWMLKNHIHGLHVSAVFRALHPRLSTVLITGFPSRDLLDESDRHGIPRLPEKPFARSDPEDAVTSALAGPAAATELGPAIAALALDPAGRIQFASERARQLCAAAGLPARPTRLAELIEGDGAALLVASETD